MIEKCCENSNDLDFVTYFRKNSTNIDFHNLLSNLLLPAIFISLRITSEAAVARSFTKQVFLKTLQDLRENSLFLNKVAGAAFKFCIYYQQI